MTDLPTREHARHAVALLGQQSLSISAARKARQLIEVGNAYANGELLSRVEWEATIDGDAIDEVIRELTQFVIESAINALEHGTDKMMKMSAVPWRNRLIAAAVGKDKT